MSKLTVKQEKFIQELIKGKSQRAAYRIAYTRSLKWKDNAVDVNACKLFNNANVKLRYNELRNKLIKEAEDECIVSSKEVLKELKKIGFSDIKDYLSFRNGKVEMLNSEKVDGRVIQEISLSEKGKLTFKLYDKLSALDKLGKHLGMFTDKVEISGSVNNPMAGLSTDELKKLINNG